MNNVKVKTFRSNDKWHVVVTVINNFRKPYNVFCVEFRHGLQPVKILSTSKGTRSCNKVWVRSNVRDVEIEIYHNNLEEIECITSYLQNDEIVHYENEIIKLKSIRNISSTKPNLSKIGNTRIDLMSKINEIETYRSHWELQITIDKHIIVSVKKSHNKRTFFAFGEVSNDIRASDFIFSIEPETDQVKIPREILWRKQKLYSHESALAVSELVEVKFSHLTNKYCKAVVSNTINFADLPNKTSAATTYFTDPFGRQLDKEWSISETSQLPVYVG